METRERTTLPEGPAGPDSTGLHGIGQDAGAPERVALGGGERVFVPASANGNRVAAAPGTAGGFRAPPDSDYESRSLKKVSTSVRTWISLGTSSYPKLWVRWYRPSFS